MREICRRPIRRSTKSGRVLTGIRKGRRSKRLRASNAGPRCRTGGRNTVRSAGKSRSRRCAKHASAPTASASPARRRTRRGIQPPDCRKRYSGASFLNRGKPSYAHGFTSGQTTRSKTIRHSPKQKCTTIEARKPLRPSQVERMPPSRCIKTMRYPQCKKRVPPLRRKNAPCPK